MGGDYFSLMLGSEFALLTCNVNGLNAQSKREELLTELILRKIDIAIVTDSRLNEISVNQLRQNQNYNCIYNVLEVTEEDGRKSTS